MIPLVERAQSARRVYEHDVVAFAYQEVALVVDRHAVGPLRNGKGETHSLVSGNLPYLGVSPVEGHLPWGLIHCASHVTESDPSRHAHREHRVSLDVDVNLSNVGEMAGDVDRLAGAVQQEVDGHTIALRVDDVAPRVIQRAYSIAGAAVHNPLHVAPARTMWRRGLAVELHPIVRALPAREGPDVAYAHPVRRHVRPRLRRRVSQVEAVDPIGSQELAFRELVPHPHIRIVPILVPQAGLGEPQCDAAHIGHLADLARLGTCKTGLGPFEIHRFREIASQTFPVRPRHRKRTHGEVKQLLIAGRQRVLQTGQDRHRVMVEVGDVVA